ncbi:MAG: helix-turn-helix domain-containing protein [Bacteroidota bacterium]
MMQYLFVSSGSLTLFIIILILGRRNRSLSNTILIVWLMVFLLNIVTLFILYEATPPFSIAQSLLLEFSEVSIFAHGPLFWLYTRSLTEEDFTLDWKHRYHFIPFVIAYVLFLAHIFSRTEMAQPLRNTITILKMASFAPYVILVLVQLKGHRIRVARIFSNIEEKTLQWISFLGWGILVIWAVAGGSLLLDRLTTIHIPQYGGLIAHITICIFVFFMGYFGLNQPSVFGTHQTASLGLDPNTNHGKSSNGNEFPKYKNSGLDPEGSKRIQKDLLQLMKTATPYLEKELTLYTLAEQLGVQSNHLSQVINSLEGKNFFDFINTYRVESAKEKIRDGNCQKLTLLGIAFDSGFNSKASFNRAFKKVTGQTPTEYRRSLVSD